MTHDKQEILRVMKKLSCDLLSLENILIDNALDLEMVSATAAWHTQLDQSDTWLLDLKKRPQHDVLDLEKN